LAKEAKKMLKNLFLNLDFFHFVKVWEGHLGKSSFSYKKNKQELL